MHTKRGKIRPSSSRHNLRCGGGRVRRRKERKRSSSLAAKSPAPRLFQSLISTHHSSTGACNNTLGRGIAGLQAVMSSQAFVPLLPSCPLALSPTRVHMRRAQCAYRVRPPPSPAAAGRRPLSCLGRQHGLNLQHRAKPERSSSRRGLERGEAQQLAGEADVNEMRGGR